MPGTGGREPSSLDDTSRAIIAELQTDGRKSYAAIGKAVGLSEAAVRQRVQRLLDAEVMQIVAVTDPLTVGYHRQAMVGLKVSGDVEKVVEKLVAVEEIDYVVMTAGSFDLIVEVVVSDDEHLLRLLNETIRAIDGVTSTETFVYLRLAKQTYSWGTNR